VKNILVPLDGSKLAEEALPFAKELAAQISGTLYLVRVVPLTQQLTATTFAGVSGMEGVSAVDPAAIDQAIAQQVEEARLYLQEQADKLKAGGVSVKWGVRRGVAPDEIIQCVQENQIDMVAISSHGRSGLGRLVFGSVSDKVIREVGVPVLIIKNRRQGAARAV